MSQNKVVQLDLLRRCQSLYEELRNVTDAIIVVERNIAKADNPLDKAEELYREEFELAVKVSGCFEDLMYALDKLQRERTGMDFYCNRVRKNAHKLMEVEIIDVYK
jgi:hypothetical protein